MAEASLRETIEAAVDGAAPPDPAPAPISAPDASPPAPPPAPAGDPKEPPVSTTPPVEKTGDAPAEPRPKLTLKPKPAAAAPPAPPAPPAPELKAPASWKPGLREHWKSLPPDVQSEVIRREREMDTRLQEAAVTRKFVDRFNEITSPYKALIEAEGAEPLNAFHDYLKTATLLRTGNPVDKARMVAQLVTQYGIPLQALDAYLAQVIQGGALPPPQQPFGQPPQSPEFKDPRVDQLLADMQSRERDQVTREIDTFRSDPAHEFFDDVRATMADVMDAASRRGVTLSMHEAYLRACQIEPDVKKVLDTRAAQANVSQSARTLAAARHAASSLPGPTAAPASRGNGSMPPGSVRDAILESIDHLNNSA